MHYQGAKFLTHTEARAQNKPLCNYIFFGRNYSLVFKKLIAGFYKIHFESLPKGGIRFIK